MSLAPTQKGFIRLWKKTMIGLDGDNDISWDWPDVDGYLNKIE